MPVSKQASYRPPCPRSPSTALIGIDGLLTKIRAYSPHKNKENSHAVQQLETITFLGGAVTDFLPFLWKDAPGYKLYRDGEVGIVEDVGELVAGEAGVMRTGDGGFELGHAVEIAQEVGTLNVRRLDAIFTQFSKEAAVAIVNLIRDTSEVADIVIGGTTVDMVHGHSGRYGTSGSHPDGVCDKDTLRISKGIPKILIL